MKKTIMIMVLGALVACLVPSVYAQNNQEWQSTSTMQGSGSAYTSQVTEVGATTVAGTATTTESYAPGGPRRVFGDNPDGGITNDESSPIGEPVLPLAILCVAFCAVVYLRRRFGIQNEK